MEKTENENIATCLRALSHPRRMRIFRLLTETAGSELNFQQIQNHTQMCRSSLIHHLREMERDWLLTRKRRGPQTYYRLSAESLLHSMDLISEILTQRYHTAHAA
ncbi:ArsR/SmtB family transcription factor [Halocynthiibacter sp.]|uniref:ArsR/SmtB family transcription factor n=1 Tax=Halocynthiibacter sp. TaxID=1979210 RepID=UPI003C576B81